MTLAAVVVHHETLPETLACLRSLRASARPPERIYVVDNGSRDGSAEGLADHATLIRAGANLGFSAGCNLGIARALEDGAARVLLLNSDAEVERDTLSTLEHALGHGIGIVGPALVGWDARVESLGVRFSPRTGRMINLQAPGPVDAVTGCCMLIDREVLTRAGLFDERFFYGFEDLELCLRAARHGFRTACVPAARVRHHFARTIGRRSPDRLYYAARNHLLAAELAAPLPPLPSTVRGLAITGFTLLHALVNAPAPRLSGVYAVARGVADHLRGRYGARQAASSRPTRSK